MKTIVQAWIHAHPNPYAMPGELPVRLQCWGQDMTACGYALLEVRDLEIDLPDEGKRAVDAAFGQAVSMMEKSIDDIQKKADEEIQGVRDRIAKLCALTYTPPAGDAS